MAVTSNFGGAPAGRADADRAFGMFGWRDGIGVSW
jgi:hypothetical protein